MKQLLSFLVFAALLSGCNKDKKQSITYKVNDGTSVALWKGAAPDHFHIGSFKVAGSISSKANGTIKDGSFVIPIASIENFNLPDPVKQQLLDHLKSPDFFNLALHPNATFRITKVAPYTISDANAIAGANYLLTGEFQYGGCNPFYFFPRKDQLYAG